MNLRAFERYAREVYLEIPREYREGIHGLTVSDQALPHPTLPDVYTMGMCLTEPYPSEWEGPETLRSVVVLYHGSFRRLAELDPDFDWKEQIWETLTHELRHHLESLAGEDQLEDVDYALDETFKRDRGQPFDPWYYQRGERLDEGVYRVEEDVYIEQTWSPEALAGVDGLSFSWRGEPYAVPAPRELGDVHFVVLRGLDSGPGLVELVLVRERSWWERLGDFLSRKALTMLESEAAVRPAGPR